MSPWMRTRCARLQWREAVSQHWVQATHPIPVCRVTDFSTGWHHRNEGYRVGRIDLVGSDGDCMYVHWSSFCNIPSQRTGHNIFGDHAICVLFEIHLHQLLARPSQHFKQDVDPRRMLHSKPIEICLCLSSLTEQHVYFSSSRWRHSGLPTALVWLICCGNICRSGSGWCSMSWLGISRRIRGWRLSARFGAFLHAIKFVCLTIGKEQASHRHTVQSPTDKQFWAQSNSPEDIPGYSAPNTTGLIRRSNCIVDVGIKLRFEFSVPLPSPVRLALVRQVLSCLLHIFRNNSNLVRCSLIHFYVLNFIIHY